jgi:hypothetical protein
MLWLGDPQPLLHAMRRDGVSICRAEDGAYLLVDRRAQAPMVIPEHAVNFLLERGWLTRVDADPACSEALFLLTAEGRRIRPDGLRAAR